MSRFRYLAVSPESGLLRLDEVDELVEHLRDDGLAVLPTETGYLLAAVATSLPAVRAAFAAKQRDPAHPMHIACASLAMAATYAELSREARLLLGRFTPGPLSVVVRQRETLPDELVTHHGTVGIRVPEHPATLQVISALAAPVTATSLNRSGEESREPDQATLASLDWGAAEVVPVVTDPSAVRYSSPSTLVRVLGAGLEVLRPGPVRAEDLERVRRGSLAAASRRTKG